LKNIYLKIRITTFKVRSEIKRIRNLTSLVLLHSLYDHFLTIMFNFFIVLGSLHSRPRCKEWCFVKVDHTEQIWTYLDHGCWWRCLSHLRV